MKRVTVYNMKQEGRELPLFKVKLGTRQSNFHPRTAGDSEESGRHDVLSSLTHTSTYRHNLLLLLLSFHSISWGHFLVCKHTYILDLLMWF